MWLYIRKTKNLKKKSSKEPNLMFLWSFPNPFDIFLTTKAKKYEYYFCFEIFFKSASYVWEIFFIFLFSYQSKTKQ